MVLDKKKNLLTTIFIPEDADRVTKFAALELKKYLRKITEVEFSIKEKKNFNFPPKYPSILIGSNKTSSTTFDGFTISTQNNKIFINGNNPRSTLYGVYDFLEILGCKFIEPGIEKIPKLKTISIPYINKKGVADFPLRNIFRTTSAIQKNVKFEALNPDLVLPQIDWMAKRKLNHYEFYVDYYRYDLWEKNKNKILDALLDRGFDIEVTSHSIHYFCPPDENHDFGDYGVETYQKNHPEWYIPALECGARGRWQTRVELPEVQNIITRRYLNYIRRNPELKIIGLWPDDIPMNAPYKKLNHADGYLKFWNRIGKCLLEEFPGKLVGIIGYMELLKPPKKVTGGINLHCWFCPMEENWMYPITDERNKKFLNYLKGWIDKMPPYQVAIFEYYGESQEFIPFREKMKKDLPAYKEIKLGGIYGWAGFGYNILGREYRWALDFFVLTHLLWNTEKNIKTLEEIWAETVFGNTVGPYILDFYDLVKKEYQKETKKGLVHIYQWISLDVLHKIQKILSSARKKAINPETIRRIDLLEKTACYGCTEEMWRTGQPRKYFGL